MNTAQLTADILARPEWTQKKLADHLGVSQGTISRWLKGTDPEGPNRDRLREIHENVSKGGDAPAAAPSNASFPPRFQRFDPVASIPLRGQTVGGPNGRFVLNGQELSRLFAPPGLEAIEGAYAVQVYGTSMEPSFRPGQTIWLNPVAPVRAGDFVVAQIMDGRDQVASYIKEFVSQSSKLLKLRQLNPGEGEEELLTFPADKVFSVHKVVFSAFV